MSEQTPYFTDATNTLLRGHVLDVLPSLADGSVHAVVTSPPYYGLRDYGTGRWVGGDPKCTHSTGRGTNVAQTKNPNVSYPPAAHRGGTPRRCGRCGARRVDNQIGLEETPSAYVDALRSVFAEIARVLRPDGAVWLNLGDCYYTGRPPGPHSTDPKQPARRGWVRPLDQPGRTWAKPKDLLGMPWRVAFALQDDGWWIRSAVVWHKTSALPESVTDRPASRYEHIFLLSRSRRYWFDLDAIRQPHRPSSRQRAQPHRAQPGRAARDGLPNAGISGPQHLRREQMVHPRGANPGNVWSIAASGYRGAHFATFPMELARRCVLSACPKGGTVLDPFVGAGTTLVAAREQGRHGIGIDLSGEYLDLAVARLGGTPCSKPKGAA